MKIKNILAVALAFSTIFSLGVSVPAKADTLLKEGETEISYTVRNGYTLTVPSEVGIKDVKSLNVVVNNGIENDNARYKVTIKPYAIDEDGKVSENFKLKCGENNIDYKLKVDEKEVKQGDNIEIIAKENDEGGFSKDIKVEVTDEDWAKAPVGIYKGVIVFSATGIELAPVAS